MFKHVLLPTDGTATSDIAVQCAIRFARDAGARVTVVHVIPPFHILTYQPEMLEQSREENQRQSQARATSILQAAEQLAREQGVPCDSVAIKSDSVYEAIIQSAFDRQCDLIAMASHGRRGVRGMLLGSETQKVLLHTQIPVLVYR